ncbi:hypothetical protein [Paracoccus sp. pheM1]|nr:hypothetical protein [Paracoccus sp. pheM1]
MSLWLIWRAARLWRFLGLNLNWLFAPRVAWRRGEPLRLRIDRK